MIEKIEYLDVAEPQNVEIRIKNDGKVIWINVDGACAFRACRIKELFIIDERIQ